MRLSITLLLLTLCAIACTSQESQEDKDLKYLGLNSPSTTPEVFAPGLISTEEEYEFGSVFNKAGTEFYYGVNVGGREEIRFCKLMEKGWSKPTVIMSHERYGYNDPFLSPDEKRLYFISKQALDGQGDLKDYDIWYAERTGDGWSAPINAGPNINTEGEEYYISFNKEGTMYFSSNKKDVNFDIYTSAFVNGEFQAAVPMSEAINTTNYEADVFIDPDESYIIFCARRPDGVGQGDLYISFKKEDGTWTQSKNMGEQINTQGHELCPFVTADGKYFLYTSNKDIYWVDAKVIEGMRE